MKTKAILSILVLLTIAFTLTPNPCLSAVPSLINYQGVLKDSTGAPYNNPVTMIFSIWDDSTNGNKLWEETHPVVEISHGLFNVLLGSVDNPIPDSVFDQPSAWLDVLVNGSQLSPRRQMVSVGYALHSEFTDTAEYALSAPPDDDWTVDTSGLNVFRMTGNVGIGTTPSHKLDVSGDARITGSLYAGVWQKIHEADLSSASSYTVSGLNGNVDRIYQIFLFGQASGTPETYRAIYVTPNGATTDTYQNAYHYFRAAFDNCGQLTKSGLVLAHIIASAETFDIASEGILFAPTGYGNRLSESRQVGKSLSYHFHTTNVDRWSNNSSNITSLVFNFDGSNFSGKLIIFALR
ncbi:MAG: hypothetical protein AMJ89_03580 [candidate division Zixibacteria bacterium SM23_73]|nr:MAG: hypothetical protein AMJ89_03580 [candidate division Zixibacteria bacterium SM23_73]